jgi:hypothetical protein
MKVKYAVFSLDLLITFQYRTLRHASKGLFQKAGQAKKKVWQQIGYMR